MVRGTGMGMHALWWPVGSSGSQGAVIVVFVCGWEAWIAGEGRTDGATIVARNGREERPQKKSHRKIVLLLFFLVVGDI